MILCNRLSLASYQMPTKMLSFSSSSAEQGKKILWKRSQVEETIGKLLTTYHHRPNRLNMGKINCCQQWTWNTSFFFAFGVCRAVFLTFFFLFHSYCADYFILILNVITTVALLIWLRFGTSVPPLVLFVSVMVVTPDLFSQ